MLEKTHPLVFMVCLEGSSMAFLTLAAAQKQEGLLRPCWARDLTNRTTMVLGAVGTGSPPLPLGAVGLGLTRTHAAHRHSCQ